MNKDIYALRIEFQYGPQSTIEDFSIERIGRVLDISQDFDDFFDSLVIAKPTIAELKDKKIYRYPKINLPRNKVDILKAATNLEVTRDADKADFHIISTKILRSYIDNHWIPTQTSVKSFLEHLKSKSLSDKDLSVMTVDIYNKIISALSALDPSSILRIKMPIGWHFKRNHPDAADFCDWIDGVTNGKFMNYVKEKNENKFDSIITSKTNIQDTHLIRLSNEKLTIIDETQFNSLESMIRSNDPDNTTMALEIMANCNAEESLDYVGYLFYFHYNYLKEASNWNSSNVKAFRKNLDSFKPMYSSMAQARYFDGYLKILTKHNYLTEWAFKKSAKSMLEDTLNHFGINQGFFTINLEDIKISEKYKDKLIKHQSGEDIIKELTLDPLDNLPF